MSVPSRAKKDPKDLDRTFLALANTAYQQSRQNRVELARVARACGLTNQDIADEYGVTEAAIRAMLKRSVK